MQVRDRRVRGLDLHLTRLTAASTELFGCPLPPERVLPWIDAALDGNSDASVQVTVYARHPDAVDTGAPVGPDVLVAVSAGVQTTTAPLRVWCVEHERPSAQIKHVGTYGVRHHRWRARMVHRRDQPATGAS
jgi:4-amino-4-deoxychorismate lyase